ncbi:MAG: lysylphosphatidylglycerol synthase transmembrane domain-containing protein [Deltaproteobacteria bacterium]
MKKAASVFLRIGITVLLLVFLFSRTNIPAFLSVVRQAHKGRLAAAFTLFFLLNIVVMLRWLFLVRARGYKVGAGRLFSAYLSGLFFNLVLPSTIGGDAVRTLDIAGHTGEHSSAILGTVVMDRVSGFFGLFTVLIFSLLFGLSRFHDPRILAAAGALLVLVFFMCGIMFSRRFFHACFGWIPFARLREYLCRVHAVTWAYRRERAAAVSAWLISVSVHTGLSFLFFLTAAALGQTPPFLYFLILVPAVTAFSSLPLSIGGLGLRENATVAVFAHVGMSAEAALAVSLLVSAQMFLMGLLGGVSYVATLYRRRL